MKKFYSPLKKLKAQLMKLKQQDKEKETHEGNLTTADLYRALAKLYTNLYESRLVENALNVGDKIPIDSITTYSGLEFNVKTLLAKGPIVLAFFRGTWCPYCNMEINLLQENHRNFEELGATLFAISPQSVEYSKSMVEHQGVTYPVVSDTNNAIAKKFRLTYFFTDEIIQGNIQVNNLNLKKFYGKEQVEIPLSATYVIDQDGVIAYAFIEEDHEKRADVGEVLTAIRRCKINKKEYIKKAQQRDQAIDSIIKKISSQAMQRELPRAPSEMKRKEEKEREEEKEKEREREREKEKEKEKKSLDGSKSTSSALLLVLESEEYLPSFKEYLSKTFCAENLLFYFDSREYKESFESWTSEGREATAQRIFSDYIQLGSVLEVNIDDRIRENIVKCLETKLKKDIYDDASQEVFRMMESDSFHKWRRTKEFDNIWKKNGSPQVLAVNLSFLN